MEVDLLAVLLHKIRTFGQLRLHQIPLYSNKEDMALVWELVVHLRVVFKINNNHGIKLRTGGVLQLVGVVLEVVALLTNLLILGFNRFQIKDLDKAGTILEIWAWEWVVEAEEEVVVEAVVVEEEHGKVMEARPTIAFPEVVAVIVVEELSA